MIYPIIILYTLIVILIELGRKIAKPQAHEFGVKKAVRI